MAVPYILGGLTGPVPLSNLDDNFAYFTSALSITGGNAAFSGDATITGNTAVAGNLSLTGVSKRVTGDFSNATIANRAMIQTNIVNGITSIEAIPNGTSQTAQYNVSNLADPTNTSLGQFQITNTSVNIISGARGTGTYLPLVIYASGSERLRVHTSGGVSIGNTIDPGATNLSVTGKLALGATTTATIGVGNASIIKNRIINGDMRIDQRNAGASITQTAGDLYPVDRFRIGGSVTSKFTAQQNAGAVTPPAGFVNYVGITSSSAYSVLASDYFFIDQAIEGYNTADLNWGTANAKPVTLSFWVQSSLTGTFGGSLKNNTGTQSYPFTYSIPVANTWTQVSIAITGSTTGTWLTTSGVGIRVVFGLGTGATYSATAGSWAAGNYLNATGATSIVGTSGAKLYITGVQLEVGESATSYEYRQYGQELALCQRYCFVWSSVNGAGDRFIGFADSTTNSYAAFKYPVPPRVKATGIISTTAADFRVGNPSTSGAPTAISFIVAGEYQVLVGLTTTAGSPTLANGNLTQFFPNTATCKIEFTGMEL